MSANNTPQQDWDPRSGAVLRDQLAAYDEMRERCPVAYSDFLGWSLFRHEDIVRVLDDPDTFSNAVSRHLSVPNGMDPPAHTGYRRIIEPYFRQERIEAFAPQCRNITVNLVQSLLRRDGVEFIGEFAQKFAVSAQCAFLGWPSHMHEPLLVWTQKNRQATLAEDRAAMAQIASEFDDYINELLYNRRAASSTADRDITSSLMSQQVQGRPLRNEEIVSILRNWTVGEVGTISAAVGILAHHIAECADLQQKLRAQPALLPGAIEEILRIQGPLVANRRITTRPVEINGRKIGIGEKISLVWVSANRDGRVFDSPEAFLQGRDPAAALLYGKGIHVCPGAPLARMELCVAMEELLARTTRIAPIPGKPPAGATYPASGFDTLPLFIR